MKRDLQAMDITDKRAKICTCDLLAPNNQGELNKKLVSDFITDCWIANNYDEAILTKYLSKDFKFHNPKIEQGWEGMRNCKDGFKYLKLDKIIAGENNTVIVYARCTWKGLIPVVFMDIWRIENGLLAEHWNVIQEEP